MKTILDEIKDDRIMNQIKLLDNEKFLDSLMNISTHMRYVMIYDLKGDIMYKRKKAGVVDLLTEKQNKIALNHTIDSWNFRNSLSEQIGDAKYTLQVYENLVRVIFPFGKEMLLVVTLDNDESSQNHIVERVQKILSGNYKYL